VPIVIPNGKQTFVDINGDPISGGSVYMYVPGTTDPSTTYTDQTETVANPNPVILDQAGRCVMWGDGYYRQVVYDMFGNLQWDQNTGFEITTINGPLTINGGPLTVNGDSYFNGNTSTSGNANIGGALGVGGGADINGGLTSTGYTNMTGGANVTGGLTTDNINNTGNLTVGGTSNLNGPVNIEGLLTANGGINTTNLNATGSGVFNGNFNIGGDLGVGGNAYVAGNLTAGSITDLSGGAGGAANPLILPTRTVNGTGSPNNPFTIDVLATDGFLWWNTPIQNNYQNTATFYLPDNPPVGFFLYIKAFHIVSANSTDGSQNAGMSWFGKLQPASGGTVENTTYWWSSGDPSGNDANWPVGEGGEAFTFILIHMGNNLWLFPT
jgi:hypothetical protein